MEQYEPNLTVNCRLEGASRNCILDPTMLADVLKQELAAELARYGIALASQNIPEGANIKVMFVSIDKGNQFLRWLVPFVAPAVVAIQCEIDVGGKQTGAFNLVRKGNFGLGGGSEETLLSRCTKRLAEDLGKAVMSVVTVSGPRF